MEATADAMYSLITVLLLVLVTSVACFIQAFASVNTCLTVILEITGGIFGSIINFILPAFFALSTFDDSVASNKILSNSVGGGVGIGFSSTGGNSGFGRNNSGSGNGVENDVTVRNKSCFTSNDVSLRRKAIFLAITGCLVPMLVVWSVVANS